MEGSPCFVVFLAGTKVCTACNRHVKTGPNRQRKGAKFWRNFAPAGPLRRPAPGLGLPAPAFSCCAFCPLYVGPMVVHGPECARGLVIFFGSLLGVFLFNALSNLFGDFVPISTFKPAKHKF